MRVKGYNFPTLMVLTELRTQVELARHAISRIEEGCRGWQDGAAPDVSRNRASPLELMSYCSAFLSAAALISKFLFANSRDRPRKRQRCEALRELLSIRELPTVQALTVRNAFEHLDERLDSNLPGYYVGGWESIRTVETPPDEATLTVKWLRPESMTLTFLGQEISLRDCMREMDHVDARAMAAINELGSRRVDLWDT